MVEETQVSLPVTPATNNNASADGVGSAASQNTLIANAFESDSSEENDKIDEMRNTLNNQQKQITSLINDTLFWKTKVTLDTHLIIIQVHEIEDSIA